jgi:hypothetical protein
MLLFDQDIVMIRRFARFIALLYIQVGTTSNYSVIAEQQTLQFAVTHTLGFSVYSWQRIWKSHCHCITHDVSYGSPILFLQFLHNHIRLPSPGHDSILILAASDLRYIVSRRDHRKHRFLYCCEGVFTAPLRSNGSYSVVACISVGAGMCLPSSCLTINISSDFTIPVFGLRVTIWSDISYFSLWYYKCWGVKEYAAIHTHFLTWCKMNNTILDKMLLNMPRSKFNLLIIKWWEAWLKYIQNIKDFYGTSLFLYRTKG